MAGKIKHISENYSFEELYSFKDSDVNYILIKKREILAKIEQDKLNKIAQVMRLQDEINKRLEAQDEASS